VTEPVREVAVVPHTHWDREWYAPFQTSRAELVHVIDELLDLLVADRSYTRFLLDGQTAIVDDYLAVRPEAAARLTQLVAEGRLQLGPWMILMDEFMVSGETIVRNLQLGMARAASLGAPDSTQVGYLPDMFGHVAQMPQILRLAGIEHAVVWRGVPAAVTTTAFWWRAPDGSRVRAEYLYGSYSNGRDIPDDPEQLVARARGYEAELGAARLPGGGMLLMNGSDHLRPQPWLGRVIAAANAEQADYRFAITSLGEYVASQPIDGLPEWCGELRSGARANVLMGVASNRVDVHRAAAAAERAVERVGEPLSALFLPSRRYPHSLAAMAWRLLVLNSAHDSSCACSADEVVEAVRVRYQEARQIGDALAHDAIQELCSQVDAPSDSIVVVNPVAATRGGLVALVVPDSWPVHLEALDDGGPCPTQLVATHAGEGISTVVVGRKIRWILEMMRGPELAGARIARVEREHSPDGLVAFTFHDARPGEPAIDLEATKAELLALGEAGATIAVRQRRAPVREIVFDPGAVPGFGWRTFRVVDGDGPTTAVRAAGLGLANEHVQVEVDPRDGTLTIEAGGVRATGVNRYVDGGDGGDTYNYSPPASDSIIDGPASVAVEVVESGPVRARLAVHTSYAFPSHAEGDERSCTRRSGQMAATEVVTMLELRTNERFLRVHVELDHRVRDHRLRAHFPLPSRVEGSVAECAFAVVHRGLTAEGGPHEYGLPTFVSRRFVDCSAHGLGLALLHDGLLEYEVVERGDAHPQELALTLVRATGYLSRSELSLRPNPAGPLDPLEGPQLQGRLALDYAVLLHRGDAADAGLFAAADDFLVPLAHGPGGSGDATGARRSSATWPTSGRALAVDGAVVSAVLRDDDGRLTVRLSNPTAGPTEAIIELADGRPARGEIVDLTGEVQASFAGPIALRAGEILTARVFDG
jgi:hypothetical protein